MGVYLGAQIYSTLVIARPANRVSSGTYVPVDANFTQRYNFPTKNIVHSYTKNSIYVSTSYNCQNVSQISSTTIMQYKNIGIISIKKI